MKQQLTLLLIALCFALFGLLNSGMASTAGDPLRVVVTIPDLADIVKEIGGDRVEVASICKGRENTHAVVAKPSHLVAMSKADLFVEIGLSLETAFVPGLLEGSRNVKIQPGKPGFLNCSEGWQPLEVPTSLSRQAGDVHPHGNPHMNLDPRAGRHIAGRVLIALLALDPTSKDYFEKRNASFITRLAEAEKRWAALGATWKGSQIIEYHQEFSYFAGASGLKIAGAIETKPGIPATPNHLAELIGMMKKAGVKVIVTAIWSNNDTVARIAEATGAKVVELPNMCGGLPGTDTWIGMMDTMHKKMAEALAVAPIAK